MEVLQALRGALTARELLKGATIALLLVQFLPRSTKSTPKTWTQVTVDTFVLFIFARSWLALVDHYVPEPYLDEFFHIPQAQNYCEGRYWDWDDKITTPPGLYLLSVAYHKFWMLSKCSVFTLRYINLLATLLTGLVAARCQSLIEARRAGRDTEDLDPFSLHVALNIALFPVIFFFSALYYTDVVSTLVVLVAYENHLRRVGPRRPGFLNDVWTALLAVAALLMRQTNVFWVVVYMGGLEVAHAVRSLKPSPVDVPKQMSLVEHVKFYLWRDLVGDLHDPPLDEAWPEDWLFCILSIGIGALCNPVTVLKQVWPHVTMLGLFASFVAWNGGVVLGDKSNHVATIHLAQILYIWPFFAFFSAPLLIPSVLEVFTSPFRFVNNTNGSQAKPLVLQMIRKIYYVPYILATVTLSLAIVKYNTIIHPFTLADNRHYMFYVFRYTIRRGLKIRYLLVGAYTLSRWFVWHTLAGSQPQTTTSTKDKTVRTTTSSSPLTSTALFWLLTTTLSLITAPLVEPRYFILPWVFWRLSVPEWNPSTSSSASLPGLKWLRNIKVDPCLALESVWFLLINLATMYMFLFRPFYWKTPDGELLDGGNVQRFMW
ncbi:hypothetical protein OQA88_11112 [Cercophora sp. LCS_1]